MWLLGIESFHLEFLRWTKKILLQADGDFFFSKILGNIFQDFFLRKHRIKQFSDF